MAETMSVQVAAGFSGGPRGNFQAVKATPYYVNWLGAATGTAGDTIWIRQLPPGSGIDLFSSWFQWSGFTSGATLSLGWKAYKDMDGVVQAASPAGLLSAISLTAAGAWSGGMLVIATPDDSLPAFAAGLKLFNNREPVDLIVTIGAQAPKLNDVLNGRLEVVVS